MSNRRANLHYCAQLWVQDNGGLGWERERETKVRNGGSDKGNSGAEKLKPPTRRGLVGSSICEAQSVDSGAVPTLIRAQMFHSYMLLKA